MNQAGGVSFPSPNIYSSSQQLNYDPREDDEQNGRPLVDQYPYVTTPLDTMPVPECVTPTTPYQIHDAVGSPTASQAVRAQASPRRSWSRFLSWMKRALLRASQSIRNDSGDRSMPVYSVAVVGPNRFQRGQGGLMTLGGTLHAPPPVNLLPPRPSPSPLPASYYHRPPGYPPTSTPHSSSGSMPTPLSYGTSRSSLARRTDPRPAPLLSSPSLPSTWPNSKLRRPLHPAAQGSLLSKRTKTSPFRGVLHRFSDVFRRR